MTTEDINMDNDTPRVPMDQTGWEKFRQLLHNPNNGTYLGRTPISWGMYVNFWMKFIEIFNRQPARLYTNDR